MSFQPKPQQLVAIKAALFFLLLIPALILGQELVQDALGPNPVERLQRFTGTWTFNCLLLSLCITPLRNWTNWHWLLRLRRQIGLFCFFYALLHATSFAVFDHDLMLDDMARDVIKRPFITLGMTAFLLLIPLALTSSNRAIRLLGGRRWQDLHRLVYIVVIVACLHYFWLVKASALIYPIIYTVIAVALLAWRVMHKLAQAAALPVQPRLAKVQPITFHPRRDGFPVKGDRNGQSG